AKIPLIPQSDGENVLLVEDEPALLQLAEEMLHTLGYFVLPAANPIEALKLFKNDAIVIDLLITDVVMPEMNGRELARKLTELYPGIKVLFMSGYTANVIAHHGVLEGGIHFIQKPFTRRDLATKVREVLEESSKDCRY
ncbi:MAG: response regulator, partial [Desulfopila sp.]